MPADISPLPCLNAILNLIAIVFLILGRLAILKGNVKAHRRWMMSALTTSAVFLISYLYYHAQVGSVKYEGVQWLRMIYFAILFPHILLAAAQVPAIIVAVVFALRGHFSLHVRVVKILWPVWMYVSISGILVFLMLYVLPHGGA